MWDLQHVPAPQGAMEWVLLGPVLQGPKGQRGWGRDGTRIETWRLGYGWKWG